MVNNVRIYFMKTENNYAYVDGQNLYYSTSKLGVGAWNIDLKKFRIYLEKKYKVNKAYYYLGYIQENKVAQKLYEQIQDSGFILVFRQHNTAMITKKKGNVDSDIIFSIMKRVYKKENFDKIVLVSGDGDYKNVVDFLIEENKLAKILFPTLKHASSLYKMLGSELYDSLDTVGIRNKIEQK